MDRLKPPQLLAYLVYTKKPNGWMLCSHGLTLSYTHKQIPTGTLFSIYIYIHKTFNSILTPTGPLKANERYI